MTPSFLFPFLKRLTTITDDLFLIKYGCDIARSAYAKYEAGELNVRISVLIELKKIYGCTYEDFFEGLEVRSDEDRSYMQKGTALHRNGSFLF